MWLKNGVQTLRHLLHECLSICLKYSWDMDYRGLLRMTDTGKKNSGSGPIGPGQN